MKKRVIVITLVVLLSVITIWQGTSVIRSADERPTMDAPGTETGSRWTTDSAGPDAGVAEAKENRGIGSESPAAAVEASKGSQGDGLSGNQEYRSGSDRANPFPPLDLYFIRSGEIISSSDPSDSEIERLQAALRIVTQTTPQGSIVFDADAISTGELPVILFASDEFDLTNSVANQFERLSPQVAEGAEPR